MNFNQFRKGAKIPTIALLAMLGVSPLPQLWIAPTAAYAQQSIVKGTIIDEFGEPVPGASVVVAGTTTGTITDFDGNFSLNVKPGAELRISFVGYETQTVKAKDGMTIQLSENSELLGEVEVVAYGVQKKVTMTGAVASVKSEDLVRTSVGSVNNVLGGQLSGVTTVQYSGEPGSDAAEIFVRGKATWGDAAPLIQVDGVERSMNDIDPNEIESISVLKDASATAVFGVRGANGVVLITTRRGQEGKAKISVSTSFSALSPTKMVEQASALDYALFYNQMSDNDGLAHPFSDAIVQKFRDGSDPIRFPSTKWADYIMKDFTLQHQHNINISGGNDHLKYFVSAGYYYQGGLFKEFDMPYDYGYQYNRFNYRANLDLKATKTTTISFNVAGNVNNADKPYTGQGSAGMIKNIYYATPFSSPGIVNGHMVYTTTDYTDGLNLPFLGGTGMAYFGNGFMQTNNNKIQMDLVLDQKLEFWGWSKGLSFKAKGSYNSAFTVSKQGDSGLASFNPLVQYDENGNVMYNADGTPVIRYRQNGNDTDPSYRSSQGKARDWYVEASLNYSRSFGKHTVSALALYNQSKQYYYSGTSYPDVPRSYVGFVGRVTYDWANRYMAEFNMGYNGSENFAPGRRFGTFPAGSLGWNISEESWWEPIKNVIPFLKLRASIGLVGNDKTVTATRFMYLADPYITDQDGLMTNCLTSPLTNTYAYQFGNGAPSNDPASLKGAYESAKNNPEIGWEKALKQDYGFDIHFFQDKLNTSFDYYYEHRTDILLIDGTVPSIIGFTVPYANLGETKSWGWEVSANWNDKIGQDWRYWIKFNLSYNQNEILEMKEAPQSQAYQYQKGHRIGSRSMYQFFKYYEGEKTEAEYKEAFGQDFPVQLVGKIKPGDCVYVDLNGDGLIDETDMTRDNGFTDDPQYMVGGTFGFSWKRLTFNCQLTGAWNVSRYITDVFRQPYFCSSNTTQGGLLQYHVDNTWVPGVYENQDVLYPRATWANAVQNYAATDLYEKDAKYLRVKTVSLGYDFKSEWLKHRFGISKFELTLSGYNLLTFTPYTWGDPETTASSAPSYPLQRTYTVSLNIGF